MRKREGNLTVEHHSGFEPPPPAWKAGMLPITSVMRIVAGFSGLSRSRCRLPGRRAPDRLAAVALRRATVTIGLYSVRLFCH